MTASAQVETSSIKTMKVSYSAAFGRAYFTYSEKSIGQSFPNAELRIGGMVEKPLSSSFYLKFGLFIGVKKKREAYYDSSWVPYGHPYINVMTLVDRNASSKDHYYAELPILMLYEIKKLKFGAGVSGRYYLSNAAPGAQDFIAGHSEMGVTGMVSYPIKRFTIGVQSYNALTPLLNVGPTTADGIMLNGVKVRNNFLSIFLEYSFSSGIR